MEKEGLSTPEEDEDEENVRYWSDFNRVYYDKRSLQRLPDVPDWINPSGDWSASKQIFERHNLVCVPNLNSAGASVNNINQGH
jgi:hypothetical protein